MLRCVSAKLFSFMKVKEGKIIRTNILDHFIIKYLIHRIYFIASKSKGRYIRKSIRKKYRFLAKHTLLNCFRACLENCTRIEVLILFHYFQVRQ